MFILAIITPVFRVTLSFRDYSNMLICCTGNMSYYYQLIWVMYCKFKFNTSISHHIFSIKLAKIKVQNEKIAMLSQALHQELGLKVLWVRTVREEGMWFNIVRSRWVQEMRLLNIHENTNYQYITSKQLWIFYGQSIHDHFKPTHKCVYTKLKTS